MPNDMLLHAKTSQLIAMYIANPTGGLLVSGLEGSGKEFTVQSIALALLGLRDRTALQQYPYWQAISPEGTSISIESVRSMQSGLRLRLPKNMRRVIVIIDAHTMTPEAQNALLKTLEEPPEQTFILLTTDKAEALLPTIRSRLQTIPIQLPTIEAVKDFYSAQPNSVNEQHIAIASGRIGLLDALTNNTEHPMSEAIKTAKTIVSANLFERLAMTDKLIKQKDQLQLVLDGMAIIYRTLISANAKAGKTAVANQCAQRLTYVLAAQDQLRRSVQAKLALDTLFLHI